MQTHYGIYSPWLLNEPVKIEWSHFLVPSSSKEENDSQYLAKLTIKPRDYLSDYVVNHMDAAPIRYSRCTVGIAVMRL